MYTITLRFGLVLSSVLCSAVLCCLHISRIHSQIRGSIDASNECSTFDALYARITLISYCCWCRYYTFFPPFLWDGDSCVLCMLAFGRWKMCVSNSTFTVRAHSPPHSQTHSNKPSMSCVYARYTHILPFAVLFSLCVSIFAFIYPDEFIPDRNCVQCLVSSVSELLRAYSLSVCVPFVRSFVQFGFITILVLKQNNNSKHQVFSENQKEKKSTTKPIPPIGQRSRKDTKT